MTRSQEIICTMALMLWTVQCGNWHLEGRVAKQEFFYVHDTRDANAVIMAVNCRKVGLCE